MNGETSGRGERSSRAQQRDARVLVEREIFEAGIGGGEQFGDGALVHVGVLPEVERREVEAEHVDGAAQRPQPAAGEDRAAVGLAAIARSIARSAANSAALA